MNYLPSIEIETGPQPDASVIWLHGLGASGHDFSPIVPELNLPTSMNIRFVFPHAPERPVTVNGGYVMPAWYDILEMDLDRKVDEAQLNESAVAVAALIHREHARGVPYHRILLAGFSQGGAVAYHCALEFPERLAGLAALSTYFATADKVQYNAANSDLPIQVFHGTHDPVVAEQLAHNAIAALEHRGYAPHYKNYPIEHAVCLEEIQDMSQWIQHCLNTPMSTPK